MTANEIKKALEICVKATNYDDCKKLQCPLYRECKIEHKSMEDTIISYALDLINQYEAEMQHYKEKLHNRKSEVNRLNSKVKSLKYNLKTAKAEAIKEFAESMHEQIDNLLKEMGVDL